MTDAGDSVRDVVQDTALPSLGQGSHPPGDVASVFSLDLARPLDRVAVGDLDVLTEVGAESHLATPHHGQEDGLPGATRVAEAHGGFPVPLFHNFAEKIIEVGQGTLFLSLSITAVPQSFHGINHVRASPQIGTCCLRS